jgi:hypothetical protein
MAQFNLKPGTKSAGRPLKTPFPDIIAFNNVIQSFIAKNPLGCTSYRNTKRNHPPVEKVREMYTAKFVYLTQEGKQIGNGQDMYTTIEGYQNGIAAVISNMANIAAHGGKVRHLPGADLYSAILKCHDPNGEIYFISIARDRITLSSYTDEAILKRVEAWANTIHEIL